jgi:hypothetical protein
LDNDATPPSNANCPFEGEEPLAIGGECFFGAGVQLLLFWVVRVDFSFVFFFGITWDLSLFLFLVVR